MYKLNQKTWEYQRWLEKNPSRHSKPEKHDSEETALHEKQNDEVACGAEEQIETSQDHLSKMLAAINTDNIKSNRIHLKNYKNLSLQ